MTIRFMEFVTKDSNLGELAAKFPQAARVLTEYGLHCIGCFASSWDSVEAGARLHGMDDAEIEEMVARANEAIELHPEETITENAISNDEVQMINYGSARPQ